MAVTTDINKHFAEGDGATLAFDFPFKLLQDGDLEVYLGTDDETPLTLGVDYTVTIDSVTEGGTVTFTVAPEDEIQILFRRIVPLTQETELATEGSISESALELMADKLTMVVQQHEEEISRSLRLPVTDNSSVSLVLPTPQADKLIGWNSTEDALENKEATGLDTVLLPSMAGKAGYYTRIAGGETNLEYRSTAEVLADIGALAAASSMAGKAGYYTRIAGGETNLEYRSTAEVLADIGALAAASNASAADQLTGTATNKYVTPAVQHNHKSAVKAWASISFLNNVGTVQAGYIISGIVRAGVATYTVAFSSTLADANYAINFNSFYNAGFTGVAVERFLVVYRSVSGFSFVTATPSVVTDIPDNQIIMIQVAGN